MKKNTSDAKRGLILSLILAIVVISGTAVCAYADEMAKSSDDDNAIHGFAKGTKEVVVGTGEGTGQAAKGFAEGSGDVLKGLATGTKESVEGMGKGVQHFYEGVSGQKAAN